MDRVIVTAKSPSPIRSSVLEEDEEEEIDAKLSHVNKSWDENTKLGILDLCCDLSVVLRRKKTNRFKLEGEASRLPNKRTPL